MTAQTNPMAPAIDALRALYERLEINRGSLLSFATASMENNQGQVAYAFLRHAQDVLDETPDIEDRPLMVECHVRTFFNSLTAAKYGTLELLHSPEKALQYVEFMTLSAECDERGTPMHSEAGRMQ